MSFIQHIIEPDELHLCWMDMNREIRNRFRVGVLRRINKNEAILEYKTSDEDFKNAVTSGFLGFPAFPKTDHRYELGVMDAFMRRLPPRSRKDFKDYAAWFGIPYDLVSRMSDFALLGYTGAKVANDGFSLVHPFRTESPFEFMLEVAGFRHTKVIPIDRINPGMEVTFVPDPENAADPDAIVVLLDNVKIGYVDRGRTPFMHQWINQHRSIFGTIERINGITERRLIYVRTEVSALERVAAF